MDKEWIKIVSLGNEWSNKTVYVNPETETAKLFERKITHWGYHDESEWEEHEKIISVEQALAMVYPDNEAISLIQRHMGKDYADVLKELDRGRCL